MRTALILTIAFATGWAIFDKAGQPGWATFVPIYNRPTATGPKPER